MNWIALLLFIPVILVPAVLLMGFAGCDKVFGLDRPDPVTPSVEPPINLTAIPQSLNEIRVSWESTSPIVQRYQVFRAIEGSAYELIQDQVGQDQARQVFADTLNLMEGNTYLYQVTSYYEPPGPSVFAASDPTIAYLFFRTPFSAALTTPQAGVAGFCLVQRLSKELFGTNPFFPINGTQIKLTVRGPATGPLTIDRIYVSRVAGSGDAYDSLPAGVPGGLTKVVDVSLGDSPVVLQAGGARTLGPVDFEFFHDADLLIAFDISNTPGQDNVIYNPAITGATSFARGGTQEAAAADRTAGYAPAVGNDYLVERLEVL